MSGKMSTNNAAAHHHRKLNLIATIVVMSANSVFKQRLNEDEENMEHRTGVSFLALMAPYMLKRIVSSSPARKAFYNNKLLSKKIEYTKFFFQSSHMTDGEVYEKNLTLPTSWYPSLNGYSHVDTDFSHVLLFQSYILAVYPFIQGEPTLLDDYTFGGLATISGKNLGRYTQFMADVSFVLNPNLADQLPQSNEVKSFLEIYREIRTIKAHNARISRAAKHPVVDFLVQLAESTDSPGNLKTFSDSSHLQALDMQKLAAIITYCKYADDNEIRTISNDLASIHDQDNSPLSIPSEYYALLQTIMNTQTEIYDFYQTHPKDEYMIKG